MLIKSATKKGVAIPHTPEEALPSAIEYGLKTKNGERIYWVLRESIKVDGVVNHVQNTVNNSYTAQAKGTAMIGFTDVKTDRFYDAKLYNFDVKYHTAKDYLGLPDIAVDALVMAPVNQDPSAMMNFPDLTLAAPVVPKLPDLKAKSKS